MRLNFRWLLIAAAFAALSGPATSQSLLDKGKNGGGGSSGGSGGSGGGVQNGGGQQGGVQSGGGSRGGNQGGGQQGGGNSGGSQGGGLGKGGGHSGGGTQGGGSQGGVSQGGSGGSLGGWSGGGNQNGGGVQLGRPDNNRGSNGSRGGDNNLSKKQSRSGNVQYRTQNNAGSLRDNGQGLPSLRINAAPIGQNYPPSQQGTVVRQDRTRLIYNGWRCGYYAYDRRWCDDYFYYPFYSFDPWQNNCVISPWYYYPNLPGYVSHNRVRTWTIPGIAFIGYPYDWVNPSGNNWNNGWGNNRYNDVDYAVDDLQTVFEDADRRAVGRLVPHRSDVGIFIDGRYSYSLSSDDFYDLLLDNAQNTKTRRYVIERVWRNNDGARVIARHEFEDPWGQRITVWHNVILQYERNQLVIREFGVSNYRP